jgi:hypothetical protein
VLELEKQVNHGAALTDCFNPILHCAEHVRLNCNFCASPTDHLNPESARILRVLRCFRFGCRPGRDQADSSHERDFEEHW